MKAIYINLDPYLQAVADWLNAGKPGTAPCFDPLPLAVTIPLGESVGIITNGYSLGGQGWIVDGANIGVFQNSDLSAPVPPDGESVIEDDYVCGFSKFYDVQPDAKPPYSVFSVSGDAVTVSFAFSDEEDNVITEFTVPVLVRREQASGPVDLVDFTPPAAAIAAGTDLKGTKFNGNEIVAAAGTGALSAPAGA